MADYTKDNPLRIPMYVNGLELIMGSEFQEKATVQVVIDNVTRFDSRDEDNSLKGRSKFVIPLGIILSRDSKIDVFVWNEEDENYLESEFTLFLDEILKPITSESIPLGADVYNQTVSTSEILFEHKTRYNETETKLVNMKGYKKLVVIMSASEIKDLSLVSNLTKSFVIPSFNLGTGNNSGARPTLLSDNIYTDLIGLTTPSIFGTPAGFDKTWSKHIETKITETVFDMELNILHELVFDFTFISKFLNTEYLAISSKNYKVVIYMGFIFFIRIEESDDSFSGFTLVSDFTEIKSNTKISVKIPKRYVKVLIKFSMYVDIGLNPYNGGTPRLSNLDTPIFNKIINSTDFINNIFNSFNRNGSAQLVFDILDIASNQWAEFVAHTEFETITYGQQVLSQIGDVTTKSKSNRTYALPSTQTGFRARLVVTGGIQTGVSIQKIS